MPSCSTDDAIAVSPSSGVRRQFGMNEIVIPVAAGRSRLMSSTESNVSPGQDTAWWYGGLMEIKTRAEDTAGALGVLEGRFPYKGYGPALHVHSGEDEAIYVLEGQIRFRVGDDEFVAGPGTWVWQPRGVPQAFSVESDSARALIIFTPGGLERMFQDGGVPAAESAEPPPQPQPDPETMAALATRFGFEFVGPQLG
jgi:mannose-6-phosphate isomerase-like protein (cupin superfamily)